MTNKQKRRVYFLLGLLCVLALVVGLVLYALRENINLFYTPIQLAQQDSIPQTRIRLGGMVRKGSLQYNQDLSVTFIVTDFKHDVQVRYKGVLPDLFKEGQGVVALGTMRDNNIFSAEQILAKHDENYMPPTDE